MMFRPHTPVCLCSALPILLLTTLACQKPQNQPGASAKKASKTTNRKVNVIYDFSSQTLVTDQDDGGQGADKAAAAMVNLRDGDALAIRIKNLSPDVDVRFPKMPVKDNLSVDSLKLILGNAAMTSVPKTAPSGSPTSVQTLGSVRVADLMTKYGSALNSPVAFKKASDLTGGNEPTDPTLLHLIGSGLGNRDDLQAQKAQADSEVTTAKQALENLFQEASGFVSKAKIPAPPEGASYVSLPRAEFLRLSQYLPAPPAGLTETDMNFQNEGAMTAWKTKVETAFVGVNRAKDKSDVAGKMITNYDSSRTARKVQLAGYLDQLKSLFSGLISTVRQLNTDYSSYQAAYKAFNLWSLPGNDPGNPSARDAAQAWFQPMDALTPAELFSVLDSLSKDSTLLSVDYAEVFQGDPYLMKFEFYRTNAGKEEIVPRQAYVVVETAFDWRAVTSFGLAFSKLVDEKWSVQPNGTTAVKEKSDTWSYEPMVLLTVQPYHRSFLDRVGLSLGAGISQQGQGRIYGGISWAFGDLALVTVGTAFGSAKVFKESLNASALPSGLKDDDLVRPQSRGAFMMAATFRLK